MLTREVLVIVPVPDGALDRIAAVDRCVHVVDARGWFDVELRETWPPWTCNAPRRACESDQLELGARQGAGRRRDHPRRLSVSAGSSGSRPWPALFHQLPAGASNLLRGDLWGTIHRHHLARPWEYPRHGRVRPGQPPPLRPGASPCIGPSGTASLRPSPLSPPAAAGEDRLRRGRRWHRPGGGAAVRQCRHAGDRHAAPGGSRRRAANRIQPPEGPEHLHALLEEGDGVAVCCQWTPETTKLIGREAFAAMKPGAMWSTSRG